MRKGIDAFAALNINNLGYATIRHYDYLPVYHIAYAARLYAAGNNISLKVEHNAVRKFLKQYEPPSGRSGIDNIIDGAYALLSETNMKQLTDVPAAAYGKNSGVTVAGKKFPEFGV